MDNFLRSIKITSVHSLHGRWFINCLVGLLKKILNTKILLASTKTLTNSETCTKSSIRILLRLTVSVIGQFSPRDHHSLGRGKPS
jgi:hypothetical protein